MDAFPEDWTTYSIGQIGDPLMCKRILKEQTEESGDVPFYKIGTFGRKADAYISRGLYEDFKSKYSYPKKGDILISAAGTIGRLVVFDGEDAYFQDSNIVWLGNDETIVLNLYLYWAFQNMKWQSEDGGIVSRLYNNNFKAMQLVVPPLPEQRRIAAALGDMDKLIDNLSKRIEKKKAIKQGAMQELLTGKKRLPGFEGEWEKVELVEIGQVLKGRGISRAESKTGEIPAIRYGEIYTHHNDYVKTYVSHVSEAVAAKALRLKRGDVVFAGSGETVEEIGKSVSVVDDGVCAGGDTIVFSPWEETDPLFWGFLLNIPYVQRQKSLSGHGATIIHIRPSAIKKIQVEIPDVAEQRAIAKVLGDMDEEIAKLEAKREKLIGIKKGMMSDLLTGKVRLKSANEA